MVDLEAALVKMLTEATGLDEAQVQGMVNPPKNPAHGDLAFPCFAYAKAQGRNPAEVAADMAATVALPEGIRSADARRLPHPGRQ